MTSIGEQAGDGLPEYAVGAIFQAVNFHAVEFNILEFGHVEHSLDHMLGRFHDNVTELLRLTRNLGDLVKDHSRRRCLD